MQEVYSEIWHQSGLRLYLVERKNGSEFRFTPLDKLYAYDMRESIPAEDHTVAITTVIENQQGFSKRQIQNASGCREENKPYQSQNTIRPDWQ